MIRMEYIYDYLEFLGQWCHNKIPKYIMYFDEILGGSPYIWLIFYEWSRYHPNKPQGSCNVNESPYTMIHEAFVQQRSKDQTPAQQELCQF